MILESRTSMQVPFQDVDMFSIVWHGNYPRYLEVARCQLLEKLDYTYMDMKASGYVFPVVDLKIRYVRPIEFGQKIVVTARLKEWRNWVRINYDIVDENTGERLTKAVTRQVAILLESRTLLSESPQILLDKVQNALASSR
ncbi:MAG: acyl-CoA thioesterase [Granulosicoccus sp.]